VEFIHGRTEDVILKGEFDCIVSDYLAKYVDLDLFVAHAWRMHLEVGFSPGVAIQRLSDARRFPFPDHANKFPVRILARCPSATICLVDGLDP
jgi:hypothetical protein